jgi:hypothetical protein
MGYFTGTVLSPEQMFRAEIIEKIAFWENFTSPLVSREERFRFAGYYKRILFEYLEEDSKPKQSKQ